MTLFGLLWATLLPHHAAIFYPSGLTLQAANPYAWDHRQPLPVVNQPAVPYAPLHLQAEAQKPLEVRSHLQWPLKAAIDWPHWNATAAVAVVPKGETAHMSSGNTRLSLSPSFCSGLAADPAASSAHSFTVQVKNRAIGRLPSRAAADQVASQIRQAVPLLQANPEALVPSLGEHQAAAQLAGKTIFVLPAAAPQSGQTAQGGDPQAALEATRWVNNLRLAFGGAPLDPSQVQLVAHGLGETHQTLSGTASWYGPYFHGRQTATGETFNQHELTAAHKTLPFGTYLQVRNQLNGKTVIVRINDRGPYVGDRSLDLSYAAAQCLGGDQAGVIPYRATILAPGVPRAWRSSVVAALP